MGVECLLDLLANRIAKNYGNKVIRIRTNKNAIGRITKRIDPEKRNHVILYEEIDRCLYDLVVNTFPYATIYGARELCHQVPVCFKVLAGEFCIK
ncbi:MAG: hypothetical protein FWD37_04405 [Methanomassiliicoccaceae archaeon]|nr:hypothetical protein [Methanomassiliicoccaceae archaeon]